MTTEKIYLLANFVLPMVKLLQKEVPSPQGERGKGNKGGRARRSNQAVEKRKKTIKRRSVIKSKLLCQAH